jgi:hypothetical protein
MVSSCSSSLARIPDVRFCFARLTTRCAADHARERAAEVVPPDPEQGRLDASMGYALSWGPPSASFAPKKSPSPARLCSDLRRDPPRHAPNAPRRCATRRVDAFALPDGAARLQKRSLHGSPRRPQGKCQTHVRFHSGRRLPRRPHPDGGSPSRSATSPASRWPSPTGTPKPQVKPRTPTAKHR